MYSTEEFYKDLMIKIDRELEAQGTDSGNNKENIFTQIIIDDLCSGNSPAIRGAQSISRYSTPSSDMKINGYYIDEIEHAIFVYVTAFTSSFVLNRLLSTDFNNILGKLHGFMQKSVNTPEELLSIIGEENPYYELLFYILHNFNDIDNFYYVLLTNQNVGELKLPSYKLKQKKVDISIFDIERYRRFMMGQKIVSIDADRSILGSSISCSYTSSELYDTYCCILPGEAIYRLFDSYHYQLLNSNVRTYLQLRGSVNKGIMETIAKNPDYFLAYNNGISATASEVNLDYWGKIKEIKNFQIVNGGQTSASIYNAKANKEYDISKINVIAKITVVKDDRNYDFIVKNISRYANTQNAIKFSDFSSNDSYNKKLASLSRTIYSPAAGSKLQTKWYYENVAGSYNNERSSHASQASFDKEYPKSQFFNKTDMAAYELSYQGFPAEACKGAQDAYKIFVLNLPSLEEPTEVEFKNLIAKKILYDTVLKIITDEVGGQGKASMAKYIVAYFSTVICQNKFNLNKVWETQSLSDKVIKDLRNLVISMTTILRENANKNLKGVEMYCRNQSTWEAIKQMSFSVDFKEYYSNGITINPVLSVKAISNNLASLAISISKGAWFDMSKNMYIISDDPKKDAGICKTMMTATPEELSEKQIAYALRTAYRFYKKGFAFDELTKEKFETLESELEKIGHLKIYSTAKYFVKAQL